MRAWIVCLLTAIVPAVVLAHDTWVETNTSLVRLGEIVHVDLKLGNHGNDHRDFKLAGKVSLEPCQILVIGPRGDSVDLKPNLIDTGLTPKEGYWTARYTTEYAGLHVVTSTADSLRGTTRSIRSAKAYFVASKKLDDISIGPGDFDKPLGHGLEIIPLSNPVTAMGPGQPIRVKVLLQSKPMNEARVTFVPRGVTLEEGFDKQFERTTDENGVAAYTPSEGNVVLVVVHHSVSDEKGDGYDNTKYSATLTIAVPQICPHCDKPLTSN